jgi:hypothetical protein
MKQIALLFVLTALLSAAKLSAQDSAPATVALAGLTENISRQLLELTTDTSVTFEQMRPLFAAAFEQYRAKARQKLANQPDTRYLFIVTLDGLRWQELFMGADSALLFDQAYTRDSAVYRARYQAATPEARRKQLMPFLWSKIAAEGQIHGNRNLGSQVNVANGMWFSYPGYNEMFTGKPDDARIFTNAKLPNPNPNVLEYINKQRGFRNKVAAFTSWDAFPAILNEKRSGFPVSSGTENQRGASFEKAKTQFEHLSREQPTYWGEAGWLDFFTWSQAFDHIRSQHPRVAYLGLGDTDEFAHEGHYDLYLDAAHQADLWLAELWQFIQKDKKYQGKSTLFITTDHGRGDKVKKQWRDHSAKVEGADAIWFAAIGPDTPALGEVRQSGQIWQKQFAQTFARLLGLRFQCDHEVAPPIESVLAAPVLR